MSNLDNTSTLNTTYTKGFNVNEINNFKTTTETRKHLLSLLSDKEQKMFKCFVASVTK